MKIFLTISFSAISEICIMLVLEIMQASPLLFNLYISLFQKGVLTESKFYLLIDWTVVALQFFMDILFALILWLLLKLIIKSFSLKNFVLDTEGLFYLIGPSLVGIGTAFIFRGMIFSMKDGIPNMIYDNYPFLYLMVPVTLALILIAIVMNIVFYQRIIRKNEEIMNAALLTKQISAMEEHFAELERANDSNRRLRHDLKNLLSLVLANNGHASMDPKWREYISDLALNSSAMQCRISTGNTVVDSLLNMKWHEAMDKAGDLDFMVDEFMLPKNLKIHSYDLSIILGNALDNAIEACERLEGDKYIELTSSMKKEMLFIHLRNSFNGRIKLLPGERLPASTKNNSYKHGIGMGNMQLIADKYFGAISYETKGNDFLLTVMLQNREPAEKL